MNTESQASHSSSITTATHAFEPLARRNPQAICCISIEDVAVTEPNADGIIGRLYFRLSVLSDFLECRAEHHGGYDRLEVFVDSDDLIVPDRIFGLSDLGEECILSFSADEILALSMSPDAVPVQIRAFAKDGAMLADVGFCVPLRSAQDPAR